MTQNQFECGGWKSRRAKTAQPTRRPVICGFDEFNRYIDSTPRAQLIAQIMNPMEQSKKTEFGSYFYATQNNNPMYSVMSHGTYSPERRKHPIISSYPSTVALRWNPRVEVSSPENSQTEIQNEQKFHCKCASCRMKTCRAKNPSSDTLKPKFKDNVMTFSDKSTMTLRLKNAVCAARSCPSTPKMSSVSVSSSACENSPAVHKDFSSDCGPNPILKKQYFYTCDRCGFRNDDNVDVIQQPERDVDGYDDCAECLKTKSVKSIFKLKKAKPNEIYGPRKTIYNEGIKDSVPIQCPIPSHIKLNAENSRVSIASKAIPNKFNIPFSHKNHSKYHNTCKVSSSRLRCGDNDDLKQLIAGPEILKRRYVHRPITHPKLADIKLPRKVLTSEKDIDAYVDKEPKNQKRKGKKK